MADAAFGPGERLGDVVLRPGDFVLVVGGLEAAAAREDPGERDGGLRTLPRRRRKIASVASETRRGGWFVVCGT